jgi:hypothetical protein
VAIYQWLAESFENPRAPLGTCRLLLTPLDGNKAVAGAGVDIAGTDVPTLDNVLRAAYEWKDDASAHPDGMTFCYIAGHGISMGRQDHIMLCHDFGDGVGSTFLKSISVLSLWRGMSPNPVRPGLARTQLYFVDSAPSLPEPPPGARPTDVFDPTYETTEEQVALVFTAAAPTKEAGGLSVLSEALLECLAGAAAEPVGERRWVVTTDRLVRALPERVRRKSTELGIREEVTVSGLSRRSELVTEVTKPPPAQLRVNIPASLGVISSISVKDAQLRPVASRQGPFGGMPVTFDVPVGVYLIEADSPGERVHREFVTVDAPGAEIVLHPAS